MHAQLTAALHQLAGQPPDEPITAREAFGESVEICVAAQTTGGHPQSGVEFMQVPAQPVDHPGAFADDILAVIDQQFYLAGRPVKLRDR